MNCDHPILAQAPCDKKTLNNIQRTNKQGGKR